MSQKTWIFWMALVILGLASFFVRPVAADSQAQVVYQTPTARPDGRVIYIVQPGDSCLRIQLLTGATIDELRTLNKLDQACTINPNQELLLKVVTPAASPTPNPKFTVTPLLPTQTPIKGTGKICVLLYNDVNGNAVHEDTETSIAGGAVSITARQGNFSKTLNTTEDVDPQCIDVPEGDYSISMGIPSGYNPTVMMDQQIKMLAGDQAILEFGAQVSTKATEVPVNPAGEQTNGGSSNTLLAIVGGLFLALGIGLGGYIFFTRR